MRRTRVSLLFLIVGLTAVALAGCDTEDRTFQVEAQDFSFAPETLTGEADVTMTFNVTNAGGATHTFTIDEIGIDEELEAGATVEFDAALPAVAGTLRFYCRFHESQGMEGTIEVE
jgi:plastocyanin